MAAASFDVIVIGAGVAGLAAAAECGRAGRSVVLVEARDRVGGRIWTRREAGLPVPVELGAEFIHGEATLTRALLAQGGVGVIDSVDSHYTVQQGEVLPRDDFFTRVQQAIRGSDALVQTDLSFDEYLDQHLARVLSFGERQFARVMAEGFDAADTSRASARALAAEWTGEALGDAPQSRPEGGYESLLGVLLASAHGRGLRLRLASSVRSVRWSRGSVRVFGRFAGAPFELSGARALDALPLGVLQLPPAATGAVEFAPSLEAKRTALAGLVSGAVVKILLRFASPFWERIDQGRYREASFLHAPHADIPTFWTQVPARAPLLVAWAGGPRALRATALAEGELLGKTLESLRRLFGRGVDVAGELEAYYYHDWQHDPFAAGAYSYVTVGADAARATLAQPIDDTLFFAGEATDTADEAGTVNGALESGVRAAREVLAV
jgi:monoamine oxidase